MNSFNQGFLRPIPDSGGISNIKSVQRGTFSTTGTSIYNIAISSVDLKKSIVIVNLSTWNTDLPDSEVCVQAILTSSTNLQLKNITAAYWGTVVSWTVIEFNNVKSLQNGVKSISSATDVITISNVNISKSLLFYSWTSTTNSATQGVITNCYLNSSTQITIKQNGGYIKDIAWQVIEFN